MPGRAKSGVSVGKKLSSEPILSRISRMASGREEEEEVDIIAVDRRLLRGQSRR